MQAQCLTASHYGWEASTMPVSIPKKKKKKFWHEVEPLRTVHISLS